MGAPAAAAGMAASSMAASSSARGRRHPTKQLLLLLLPRRHAEEFEAFLGEDMDFYIAGEAAGLLAVTATAFISISRAAQVSPASPALVAPPHAPLSPANARMLARCWMLYLSPLSDPSARHAGARHLVRMGRCHGLLAC